MRRTLAVIALLLTLLPLHARWAAGITGVATYNTLSGSPQYAYDLRTSGAWGWNIGLTGQYTFNKWLGIRADMLYLTKNHKQHRGPIFGDDRGFTERNAYIQLPVTAEFTFGPENIHGILNLGLSCGWWASRHRSGKELSLSPTETSELDIPVHYSQSIPFDSRRDNRLDVSPLIGIGIGWCPTSCWELIAEGRLYYSLTSVTKKFQGLDIPRHNTTISLGVTVLRRFGL